MFSRYAKILLTTVVSIPIIARHVYNKDILTSGENFDKILLPTQRLFNNYAYVYPYYIANISSDYVNFNMINMLGQTSYFKERMRFMNFVPENKRYNNAVERLVFAFESNISENNKKLISTMLETKVSEFPDCVMNIPEKYITESMCWSLLRSMYSDPDGYLGDMISEINGSNNGKNYWRGYPNKIPKNLINQEMRKFINSNRLDTYFQESIKE